MTRGGELRALTGARGIAAWLVVLYHIRLSLPPVPGWAIEVISRGYLAVDFFFLLSGFVISLSWGDRIAAGGVRSIPGFLKRRFARVWPLHAVVLSGGMALALLLAATGRHLPGEFPFDELPLHYLLVQNWGLTDRLAWNDPAWSISAELAAYLLFPVVALTVGRMRGSTPMLLLGIAAAIAALAMIFARHGATGLNHDIPHLGVVRCVIEFGCGAMLHALWRRWRSRAAVPMLILSLFVVGIGAMWANGVLRETIAAPASFAAGLMVLALTAGRWGNPLEWRPAHLLGEWSYATYLAHFLMWKAFKLAFVSSTGPVGWPTILSFLALVMGASWLLYTRVELPAQAWVNGGKRRRAARPAAALR